MIGRGRMSQLTTRLRDEDKRFSDRLFRLCGARLAFHRRRNVLVVYREGRGQQPDRTYADIGNEHRPLSSALLNDLADTVRGAEACMAGDLEQAIEIYNKMDRERQDKDTADYVDERLPDFMRDFERRLETIRDGRHTQKYHDMGAVAQSLPSGKFVLAPASAAHN